MSDNGPEKSNLSGAIREWAAAGRREVSASERLKQLRQAQSDSAPRVSRWPAVMAAACVLLMIGGALITVYMRSETQTRVKLEPVTTEKPETPDKGPAELVTESVAFALDAANLFRVSSLQGEWTPVAKTQTVNSGDYVQVAADGRATLKFSNGSKLILSPGTILKIGPGSGKDLVELWRGRVQVFTNAEDQMSTVLIGTYEHGGKCVSRRVNAGSEGVFYTDPAEELVFLRAVELKPKPVVFYDTNAPAAVSLSEGSANLLRIVKFSMKDQPLQYAVAKLAAELNIEISLSEQALARLGQEKLSLDMGEATGAEILSRIADKFGLRVSIRGGKVVLELANEKKAALETEPDQTF